MWTSPSTWILPCSRQHLLSMWTKNHWAKMRQQARKKLTGSHKQTGLPNIKNLDQPSLHLKTGRAVLMFRTRCVTNLRECLSIQCVTTKKKCPRSEAFATLDVILPNRKGIHDLKIKVDTGAEGNTPHLTYIPADVPEMGRPERSSTPRHNAKGVSNTYGIQRL